ncbi:MAG: hypothetical protein AB7F66_07335 [Bacteriovoracia bacterium]
MITDVRRASRPEQFASDSRGQSVLEFLFLLPILVGVTVTLVRVNTAIQMSIVNQQYARAQALFLAFNSPTFPELSKRVAVRMREQNVGMMVVGVTNNLAPDADNEGAYIPEASIQAITRPGQRVPAGLDDPGDPRAQRANVRIRNTVAICTQSNSVVTNDVSPTYCGRPY